MSKPSPKYVLVRAQCSDEYSEDGPHFALIPVEETRLIAERVALLNGLGEEHTQLEELHFASQIVWLNSVPRTLASEEEVGAVEDGDHLVVMVPKIARLDEHRSESDRMVVFRLCAWFEARDKYDLSLRLETDPWYIEPFPDKDRT